jgi:hypothetical protein
MASHRAFVEVNCRRRRRARRAFGRLGGLLMALAGCGAHEPALDEYEFSIRVESDPGRLLSGATLLGTGESRTVSDEAGLVRLRVTGQQGQRLQFQVRCPYGHRSPEQPLEVTLTRLGAEAPPPEYAVRCAPELRSVVIAVRAQQGPDLPVTYLGREVARTDRSGAAHVTMQLPPHEPIELSLDTSAAPRLKPRNPTQSFEPPDVDAILLFDASFVVDKPPPKPKRPRATIF